MFNVDNTARTGVAVSAFKYKNIFTRLGLPTIDIYFIKENNSHLAYREEKKNRFDSYIFPNLPPIHLLKSHYLKLIKKYLSFLFYFEEIYHI